MRVSREPDSFFSRDDDDDDVHWGSGTTSDAGGIGVDGADASSGVVLDMGIDYLNVDDDENANSSRRIGASLSVPDEDARGLVHFVLVIDVRDRDHVPLVEAEDEVVRQISD